ncbi:IS3 family transposase [Anaerotignum lactatifermentans]|uniref:IS3 family transposase n=1 Tax=Anaerotignum lactatifermentans TaxID=160404 RepID=UPI003AB8EC05
MKNEMFYNRSWQGISISAFIDELNRYMIWYREKRIKQPLGAMSPIEFRKSLGLVT